MSGYRRDVEVGAAPEGTAALATTVNVHVKGTTALRMWTQEPLSPELRIEGRDGQVTLFLGDGLAAVRRLRDLLDEYIALAETTRSLEGA